MLDTPARPETATGTSEFVSDPSPSRPESLLPQHRAEPSVNMAQVCASPAARAAAPARFETTTGTNEGRFVPLPSWPRSEPKPLLPQHRAVPSVSAAQVWLPPAEMAATPLRPETTTGTGEFVVVPSPSRPEPLFPQQRAVPSV